MVQGLPPFSVFEKDPFGDCLKEMMPNAKVISWQILCSMIDALKDNKLAVTEAKREVDYIATTTDC